MHTYNLYSQFLSKILSLGHASLRILSTHYRYACAAHHNTMLLCPFVGVMPYKACRLTKQNQHQNKRKHKYKHLTKRPMISINIQFCMDHSRCNLLPEESLRESIPRLFNGGKATTTTRCVPACSQALPVKPQGVWVRGIEAWAGSRDLRNQEFRRWGSSGPSSLM